MERASGAADGGGAEHPVVVVGGGPSGLACAWELARRGRRVVVLEREDREGGLCATHEKSGFRFDLGGHRFVSSNADLARAIERLLGDDLLERERRSVVLHAGRTFRYPLDARDLIANLGWRENAVAFGGYAAERARRAVVPARRRAEDRTFEDWVTARFGRPLYATFFGPYTEKLWGIPARAISADWAAQRIGLLHLGDAALRLAGIRRREIRTYARRYLYPRLGMGQLFARVADEARALGAEVLTEACVTGYETAGRRVVAVRARVRGVDVRIPCAAVYATGPLPDLARALGPLAADVEAAAARLRFRAIRFVNVMLRRAAFGPNTWMYVADPASFVARIQEPRHRSPAMAPAGCTSVMLEIPCDAGDRTWSMPDADLAARGLAELARLGFDVRDDVIDAFTVKVEHGYPVYHLGYARDRDAVLAHVARHENVLTGGRQGLFRYIFLDAAMEMGGRAAAQIAGGAFDVARIDDVRTERRLIEATALTA